MRPGTLHPTSCSKKLAPKAPSPETQKLEAETLHPTTSSAKPKNVKEPFNLKSCSRLQPGGVHAISDQPKLGDVLGQTFGILPAGLAGASFRFRDLAVRRSEPVACAGRLRQDFVRVTRNAILKLSRACHGLTSPNPQTPNPRHLNPQTVKVVLASCKLQMQGQLQIPMPLNLQTSRRLHELPQA